MKTWGVKKWGSFWARFLFVSTSIAISPQGVRGQSAPPIEHRAATCIPNDRFLVLTAVVRPQGDVGNVRLHFRAGQVPQFSHVDMEREGDHYRGILLMPAPETDRVVYYIEAGSARTEEVVAEVKDGAECKRRDPAAVYHSEVSRER